ncbi:GntR family transcriptional regulator [Microbacterium sp. JZ37]|uniref:GntR family transcriptional regulator n=1 Tax=Microbacterium sp. JZ37 TaxID=2654193 RepID=UPI002B45B63C|nr:GntR family transcriptional regulator [Microbacterium sp. JZ37]WRH18128.1 FCD domain-containing protein [Microbacterium sp. JZ37]
MPHTDDRAPYATLRAAILSFDLLPGESLSERGLEPLTGASRTPIRAALLRLEGEGLTRRDGRGWRVAPIDLSEVHAAMEFREAVETGAVALVVDRASDDDLAALRALAEEPEHDDEEAGVRDGGDFHVALARLSGNAFFADALADVMTRLSRTRWLEVRTPQARAHARDEHAAILDAILAREAETATALVAAHARGTRERLVGFLEGERRRLRGRGMAIVDGGAEPSAG